MRVRDDSHGHLEGTFEEEGVRGLQKDCNGGENALGQGVGSRAEKDVAQVRGLRGEVGNGAFAIGLLVFQASGLFVRVRGRAGGFLGGLFTTFILVFFILFFLLLLSIAAAWKKTGIMSSGRNCIAMLVTPWLRIHLPIEGPGLKSSQGGYCSSFELCPHVS